MSPILVECHGKLPRSPVEIAAEMLDLENWSRFRGWGPIPGIQLAEYSTKTELIVGTRIRVTNLDGSHHVEEIMRWQPDRCIALRMAEFSVPLSRLASHFDETWLLKRVASGTQVRRRIRMFAKTRLGWCALWAISWFLRRAISRHLKDLSLQSSDARTPAR